MLKILDQTVSHLLNLNRDQNILNAAPLRGLLVLLGIVQAFCSLHVMLFQTQLKSRLSVLIVVQSIFDGNDCGDLAFMSTSGASKDLVRVFLLYLTVHLNFVDSSKDQS
jgi:hypothetical protein